MKRLLAARFSFPKAEGRRPKAENRRPKADMFSCFIFIWFMHCDSIITLLHFLLFCPMLTCLLRRSCSFSLRAQAPKPRQALHHRCLRCLHSKPAFADEKTVPHFESRRLERTIYDWWEESGLFKPIASSSSSQKPFVVPMPPPNVTGYLHMGHAIFLALQDIIVRYHRMTGRPTLWIPGT